MASHARRDHFQRAVRRAKRGFTAVHGLLLVGSFLIGAALEWVRSTPWSAQWGWRADTFAILVAAWLGVALLAYWPHLSARLLPRAAGLLLAVLFFGTLLMHALINSPHTGG